MTRIVLEEIAQCEEMMEKNKDVKKGKRARYFQKFCGCLGPSTSYDEHSSGGHSPPPKHPKTPEDLINLVIECKVFIRDLHSEGAEGSLIDIFSFMDSDPNMNDLKNIFELSKIQTEKLDQAIYKRIYEEHKEGIKNKHAVVQGAGPVGLYATYKLFMGNFLFLKSSGLKILRIITQRHNLLKLFYES
ncbi:unnamed protein product [Meloidogyne enterolobii]|uniref:Uncharacterized protein n=1 Tax=Meloidogyne enterolobii TaxID=390850 RepID=A0ACB1AHG9_MELEN